MHAISRVWVVVLLLGLTGPPEGRALEANGRMYCASVRINPGFDVNNQYELALTTINSSKNGELAPNWLEGPSHYSYVVLTDRWLDTEDVAEVHLDLPPYQDADNNGYTDFFETSQSISGTSSGTYDFDFLGSGIVQVTWNRAAGSSVGSCTVRLKQNAYTTWLTTTHTFEILEWTGKIPYIAAESGVNATVHWSQTDSPDITVDGQFAFSQNPTNAFDELDVDAGIWTNLATMGEYSFFPTTLYRESTWPTNYYGWVDFLDGSPASGEEDYISWMLSIDDPNDSDKDGIPDFSDDPATQPLAPSLKVAAANGGFQLSITGESGRTYVVESCSTLGAGWTPSTNVLMTNQSQAVLLRIPQGQTAFWRVKVE
jgi:hypothetical protein